MRRLLLELGFALLLVAWSGLGLLTSSLLAPALGTGPALAAGFAAMMLLLPLLLRIHARIAR